MKKGLLPLALFSMFACGWSPGADLALARSLQFQPPSLERTLFSAKFHTLTITGQVPEGAGIILKIVSPRREFKLNKLGKGLGFVWLPTRHAEVSNVPGMWVLLSSAKLSELLGDEEQKAAGLASDFQEIYPEARVVHQGNPQQEEAASLQREYLSGLIQILKQADLYQWREGAVKINGDRFEAQLIQPAAAPLGEYRVFCYAVKGGKARLLEEESFQVQAAGLAQWLSLLSRMHPAAYGILAALIAVAAGIFVGTLFKKGSGH
jgi:hypothetical protein